MAFPSVRAVKLGAQRASFASVEIEDVGEFAFVTGLGLRVVQGSHAVTLTIG